jgi:hypothetical protein
METTEVFVDQVLIGFLVIAIFVLPFPAYYARLLDLSAVDAVGLTWAAYLIGILFDRFANTLLDGIEHRHRLAFAWEKKPPEKGVDPFAEDRILIALGIDDVSADWIRYLRSRIRLSRSLAAFLPALTLSAVLHVEKESSLAPWLLALVSAVYFAAYLAFQNARDKLPRTYQRDSEHGIEKHRWNEKDGCRCQIWCGDLALIVLAIPFAILVVLLVQEWWSEMPCDIVGKSAAITVAGLAMTWIAMLSWLKIRTTMMWFLYGNDAESKLNRERAENASPKSAWTAPVA